MEKEKDKSVKELLDFYTLLCVSLWVMLLVLKVAGVLGMEWIDVGIALVVTPWIVCACVSLVGLIFYLFVKLKRWNRQRKADARIIRQAKAAGVWDKPKALGGRALELKAWQDFKIKRCPHEPDKLLRARYMAEKTPSSKEDRLDGIYGRTLARYVREQLGIQHAPGETDEELRARVAAAMAAPQPPSSKGYRPFVINHEALELTDEERRAIDEATKQIAAIVGVPHPILTGEWKKESDQNQEGDRING